MGNSNKIDLNLVLKYWLPVVIWAFIIFIFSSRPTGTASQIVWTDFFIKKTAHVLIYGGLSTWIYRACINSDIAKKQSALIAIFFSFLYGLSDEFHQSFTPGRTPRLYDVGFDTIGASLAIYTIWKQLPKAPQPLKNWAKKLEIH